MADEGVNYFPLYCVLDEKFELLEAEYGLKGFAIVVKLFQRIYGGHGYYCEWNEDISLMFAKQCGFSNVGVSEKKKDPLGGAEESSPSGRPKNLIDLVVEASTRRGIFDERLYKKYSILTSKGIQRNFLNIVRNRKKVEIREEYLLLSDAEIKGNVVRIGKSYVRNDESYVRFEQSKVKESKVKESKERETPRVTRFEDFWNAYPNKQRRNLAEKAYCDLLLSGSVTEDGLVLAATNYARYAAESGDKMYLPNNFLEKGAFGDYLEAREEPGTEGRQPGETEKEEDLVGDDWMDCETPWGR